MIHRRLAQYYMQLEEKLRNDALRKQKLEELKRGGNTILTLPEEEIQDQYNRICDQYRTCCMIVVASDNQLCDAAARLAISHGVEPRIIHATLEGDRLAEFGQYTVGLNPFNLPECVKEDAPNYLIKTAENTLTVLSEVAPERMKTDEPYIDALKEKLMTAIVFITILHCQYVSKYDADWVEVHLVATGFGILKKMLDELETRAEENSALVNYSPPSRCTRLEEGASIRRSLFSRLRGVKFTGRFLTVQTLQTILCSELTPASQPVLCKVILYSHYIFCLFYYILSCLLITIHRVATLRAEIDSI